MNATTRTTVQGYSVTFTGVGNAHSHELGNSAGILEHDGRPLLLIDCGQDTVDGYTRLYNGRLPTAIFLTHTHLDHIGGLEGLFYRAYFNDEYRGRIKLYVPVRLIDALHKRVADYPGTLAEGGANFWDCFQLIPVSEHFWHEGLFFTAFPARHHQFMSAYGLSLPGVFLYTGDTRPIPEVINTLGCHGETIFHDCCVRETPSHSGITDILREYRPEHVQRMVFYHYESADAGQLLEQRGHRIAKRAERIMLTGNQPAPGPHPQLTVVPAHPSDETLATGEFIA